MNGDIYDDSHSPYASLSQLVSSDKPSPRKSNQSQTTSGSVQQPLRNGTDKHSSVNAYVPDTTNTPPPSYSSRAPNARHSPKRAHPPPTKMLGAIDENGGMAPDIPIRNPRRQANTNYLKAPSFISSLFPSASPKLAEKLTPPESEYDGVKGPHGEKLVDARQNRRSQEVKQQSTPKRGGWRTWVCLALVLVMIVALTAIGLVVGLMLTRKKAHSHKKSDDSRVNGTWSSITTFPVGSYTLQPYLLNTSSLCTPNAATWRCYPYQTYAASQSSSMTTLDWVISGQNVSGDAQYSISATSNPFALPFNNASVTLVDHGMNDERWSFQTVMQKVVIPDASITADGSTARCYYNSSVLVGELFTKRAPNLRTGSANDQSWPNAVQVTQTANSKPDCWKMVNGEDTERVDIGEVGSGECTCDYADFEGGG